MQDKENAPLGSSNNSSRHPPGLAGPSKPREADQRRLPLAESPAPDISGLTLEDEVDAEEERQEQELSSEDELVVLSVETSVDRRRRKGKGRAEGVGVVGSRYNRIWICKTQRGS